MKQITYAILGTIMIVTAVLVRSFAAGGFELAGLLVLMSFGKEDLRT